MAHRSIFTTEIETRGRGPTLFEVPLDVRSLFGCAKPAVRVTINGHSWRSTVALYGGRYYLPLTPPHREAAGVRHDAIVTVALEAAD